MYMKRRFCLRIFFYFKLQCHLLRQKVFNFYCTLPVHQLFYSSADTFSLEMATLCIYTPSLTLDMYTHFLTYSYLRIHGIHSLTFYSLSYFKVTKERCFNKPTYDTLRSSLVAMRDHCVSQGVTSVSMPRIGCGLDGLQWPKVKNVIGHVFQDTNINVTVYTLQHTENYHKDSKLYNVNEIDVYILHNLTASVAVSVLGILYYCVHVLILRLKKNI